MKALIRFSAVGAGLAVALLAAFVVVPTASAYRPIRHVDPAPEDMISDQCASPILAHIEGSEIVTIFTDRDQNPVKLIAVFPGNTLTLTNLDTGSSITFLGSTSSFHARAEHDGSEVDMFVGQGWWPTGNPITGEPGIWYQEGRVSATFDEQGTMTSANSTGRLVNLCPQFGA